MKNDFKKKNNSGFTLVEVIVVLVIIALLAAFFIPSLTGYIKKADKKELIASCRACVTATQTLYSERYATNGASAVVTAEEAIALSEAKGEITHIEIADNAVNHLTYAEKGSAVTYCRTYASCSEHAEMYNFEDGVDTGGQTSNPGGQPNEPGGVSEGDGLYIGDTGIFIQASGSFADLQEKLAIQYSEGGQPGVILSSNPVYYYAGKYYYMINNQYLRYDTKLEPFIETYGVELGVSDHFESREDYKYINKGDLKYEDGKVYVFIKERTKPWGYIVYDEVAFWKELKVILP